MVGAWDVAVLPKCPNPVSGEGRATISNGLCYATAANNKNLGCTLSSLIDRLRQMGMDFGIWVEPEMVSPDSDLYRAHPDWALGVPGRTPVQGRSQLVLDLSRGEVVEYLYKCFSNLLRKHHIRYVKWDMNRSLTDVFSRALSPERQAETAHRYLLNLVVVAPKPNPYPIHVRLKGLEPEAWYCQTDSGRVYSGTALMYGGYTLPIMLGDYPGFQCRFERI